MSITDKILENYLNKSRNTKLAKGGENKSRDSIEGYDYDVKELKKLKTVLERVTDSLENLNEAASLFSTIKAPAISPDGKLGGSGYVQSITDIKKFFFESLAMVSDISDTIADECKNPLWINNMPEDDQEDLEEALEEKEKVDDKIEETGGADLEVEVEVEEDSEKDTKKENKEEEEDSSVDEGIVAFELPKREKFSSKNQTSLDKKFQKISYLNFDQKLDSSKLALAKTIYLKNANLENLGRSKPQHLRIEEFKKIAKSIKFVNAKK